MDPNLKHRMIHTVGWAKYEGISPNMDDTLIMGPDINCLKWNEETTVFSPDGVDVVSKLKILFSWDDFPVKKGDRLIFDGKHHTVKDVQSWSNPIYGTTLGQVMF